MSDRVTVLGVGFDNLTFTDAVETAYSMIKHERAHTIVTPNSEIVYAARKNPGLTDALNRADLVVADGIGVVYASRFYKTPVKCKIAGIELGEALLKKLSATGESVFLLGSKPGVAELAAKNLCGKYPGLSIAGTHHGYFEDDDSIVELINKSGARVVFVCLGAPKQELWMTRYAPRLNARLLLGLGGSLDAYAGISKRAPEIWIKLGLEWFYRLVKQPTRLGRMLALPKFLFAAMVDAAKRGKV